MSVINNIQERKSEQFQILQPNEDCPQSSDEVFIQLDDWKIVHQVEQNHSLEEDEITIGVVIDEETFIVLEKKQSNEDFCSSDWLQFIDKKKKEIRVQLEKEEMTGFEGKNRITLRQRNAILNIENYDTEMREILWSIADYNETIAQDFILKQKSDQQSRQELLTILTYELSQCQVKNLKQNVFKIHKMLKQLTDQRLSNPDALRLSIHEKEIMQWIYDSLIRCAIEDQQVRYCKGLEYICLGIVIAYPKFEVAKYSQLLNHFLNVNGFRELYYQGSPRFFREVQMIKQALKEDTPYIYNKIQQNQGDFKNLFVSYFRSCLIYKVTNIELIRKIFELLFVQGIQAMKAILLRILEVISEYFLEKVDFLQTISSKIILSYFEGGNAETGIQDNFSRLFVL